LFEHETGVLKEAVRRQFRLPINNPNVLVVNVIVVSPTHRRRGLGLAILKRVIQRFGRQGGVTVMAPTFWLPGFWIDPSTDMSGLTDRDQMELLESEKPVERLISHFGRLGFEKVSGSSVLVLVAR
jgi:hypothetical protein